MGWAQALFLPISLKQRTAWISECFEWDISKNKDELYLVGVIFLIYNIDTLLANGKWMQYAPKIHNLYDLSSRQVTGNDKPFDVHWRIRLDIFYMFKKKMHVIKSVL